MQPAAQTLVFARQSAPAVPVSKARLWTGRILTVLTVLFLLFDAAGKFAMPVQVVAAFTRLGFPPRLGLPVAIVLTVCTALYAIPRTAILGAILLTGYLGGAIAIQMRAGSPLFEMLFPIIFGVFAWVAIYLRDSRLGTLVPLRIQR